jgi:DNA (cytosine-5)-methyltransferase 1
VGLSLGFQAAGSAIEIDELAARSHAINFWKGHPAEVIEHHAKSRDITEIDPEGSFVA